MSASAGVAAPARRAKGAERERAIVAAAAEAIAERGLVDLRMSDVAARAGVGVGHVTYYFPTKAELLVQAIRFSEQQFHSEVMRRLRRESDPWQRLGTLVELASSDGPGDPGWVLWFEVWAAASNDSGLAEVQRELDGWWRDRLAEVVDYGVRRGAFRGDDVDRVVAVLTALTDGLSVQLTLGTEGATKESLLATVMATAVELLRIKRR